MSEFEEYIGYIKKFHDDAAEITANKSRDYAGEHQPLRNFVDAAEIAGITVEQGILVRMADKIARARSLTEKGSLSGHVGEKLEDTLKDLSNYAAILSYWATENYNSFEVNQLKLPFADKTEQTYDSVDEHYQEEPDILEYENMKSNAARLQDQPPVTSNWYDKLLGR